MWGKYFNSYSGFPELNLNSFRGIIKGRKAEENLFWRNDASGITFSEANESKRKITREFWKKNQKKNNKINLEKKPKAKLKEWRITMGMDVYGKKPASETGKYFRANAWGWHPLADYCQLVAPLLTAKCKHWHSNDGAGLGKIDSIKLADLLQAEIDSRKTKQYEIDRASQIAELPDKPCEFCSGTGDRAYQGESPWVWYEKNGEKFSLTELVSHLNILGNLPPSSKRAKLAEQGYKRNFRDDWAKQCSGCNACHGVGSTPPDEASYHFSVETVQEFIDFLRESGGFKIY